MPRPQTRNISDSFDRNDAFRPTVRSLPPLGTVPVCAKALLVSKSKARKAVEEEEKAGRNLVANIRELRPRRRTIGLKLLKSAKNKAWPKALSLVDQFNPIFSCEVEIIFKNLVKLIFYLMACCILTSLKY